MFSGTFVSALSLVSALAPRRRVHVVWHIAKLALGFSGLGALHQRTSHRVRWRPKQQCRARACNRGECRRVLSTGVSEAQECLSAYVSEHISDRALTDRVG